MFKKIYFPTIIFFLMFFSCEHANKKNVAKNDKSSTNFLQPNKKKFDSEIRNKKLLLAFKVLDEGNLKAHFNLLKEVERDALANNDTVGIIDSSTHLGYYYTTKFANDSAYYYYVRAEKIIDKYTYKKYLAHVLQAKANILWMTNNFIEAEKNAVKSLNLALLAKDYELACNAQITIANSLASVKNYDKSILYYTKASKTLEKLTNNSKHIAFEVQIMNYLANISIIQKQYVQAIDYAQKGLAVAGIRKSEPAIFCYLNNNLGYSKLKLGDKTADKYFIKALSIGDSLQSVPIQITSKTRLGEFYVAQKNIEKANLYFNNALSLSRKNNIFEDELRILKLLSQTNPGTGQSFNKRYISLNDSLQDVERTMRDKFARIEFETDEILNQKKAVEVQNSVLKNSIWLILAFTAALLLVGYLFFRNQVQQAKNRELIMEQKQQKATQDFLELLLNQQQKIDEAKKSEKQRISQDLHDGVLGQMYAVALHWSVYFDKNNLTDAPEVVAQFSRMDAISNEIRNISNNLNAQLFEQDKNFIGILDDLLVPLRILQNINGKLQSGPYQNMDELSTIIKINVYRIVQEALQNIHKYANATNVEIVLRKEENKRLLLEIADDGVGFDLNKCKLGLGIKNMRARARIIGGDINIESSVGNGTKINLVVTI